MTLGFFWDASGNAWVHGRQIPTGPHEWVREVASEASSVCLVAILVFLGKLTDVGVKLTVGHGSFLHMNARIWCLWVSSETLGLKPQMNMEAFANLGYTRQC